MAWPVYSRTFLILAGAGGWQSYTVPPGMTAVIRWAGATDVGSEGGEVAVIARGVYVWFRSIQVGGGSVAHDLFCVVPAGDTIQARVIFGDVHAWISGHLLTDAAGRAAVGTPADGVADDAPPAAA